MENLLKIELMSIEQQYNQNAIDILLELYERYPLYWLNNGCLELVEDSERLIDMYDDDNINSFYTKVDIFSRTQR
ncbi:hypothetical protein BUY35_00040 [Staphylococcus cohnii]|nr:hypothetical protein BUY35_00040 [Staphylococcus cohnii]